MQQDYLGMFGPAGEDVALRAQQEQQAMQLAQMSPRAQVNYGAIRGGQMLGDGIGAVLKSASGQTSPENAVRAQLAAAGVSPSDPEKFYPVLIAILQRNGMLPQAMAAAREFEAWKLKQREQTRKEEKDDSDARLRQLRIEQYDPRSALQKNIDSLQKLMAARDALPEGSPERKNADVAIERMKDAIAKTHKGMVKIVDAGDKVEIINAEDGTAIRTLTKGAAPRAPGSGGSGNGSGAAAESGIKIGLTPDRERAVLRGTKTGRLYVHDATGAMVPYAGEYLPTETEGEARARGFGGRMDSANDQIDGAAARLGETRAKLYFSLDQSPVKQAAVLATMSAAEKQYVTAVREFLNANLRYDSGAAVPESEYPKYMDALIPYDGDSPERVAQKRRNRENATNLIIRRKGNGAEKPSGLPPGVTVRVKG